MWQHHNTVEDRNPESLDGVMNHLYQTSYEHKLNFYWLKPLIPGFVTVAQQSLF